MYNCPYSSSDYQAYALIGFTYQVRHYGEITQHLQKNKNQTSK